MSVSYLKPGDCCVQGQESKDYALIKDNEGVLTVCCAYCMDRVGPASWFPTTVLDKMEDLG